MRLLFICIAVMSSNAMALSQTSARAACTLPEELIATRKGVRRWIPNFPL